MKSIAKHKEGMRKWYDEIAEEYDTLWFKGLKKTYYERLNDDIIFSQIPLKGKTILDWGCGIGRFTSNIAKKAKKVVGIDYAKGMIKEAAKRNKRARNISFLVMDGYNMTFKKNSFDAVICLGSFEAIDLDKALAEISRVLKKNGYISFSMRNKWGYIKMLRNMFMKPKMYGKRKKYYEAKHYSMQEMKDALERNGMKFSGFIGSFFIPINVLDWIMQHVQPKELSNALGSFIIDFNVFLSSIPFLKSFAPLYMMVGKKK